MNATVMTTGPGVIIATATASRNWRSVSQWYWLTTPPWRNGTMASPLPKTKAPASAKYSATRPSNGQLGAASTPANGAAAADNAPRRPGPAMTPAAGAFSRGGARTRRTTTPEARNNQTISDSVQAVAAALTANTAQRRR